MARPASPALAPMIVKTMVKPMTKLSEWRNIGMCLLLALASNISGPARLARYTGTRGRTQGDRKESSPATNANTNESDIFSIV